MGDRCVAVAWSGGRDSTALLHATLGCARTLGLRVAALHVHHGLSAQADEWVGFCEDVARRWRRRGAPLTLQVRRLAPTLVDGQSVEAWARDERYRALGQMAREQDAGLVLLGHHQRDQAETFLLQALRGAGVAGLAGMPQRAERDGLVWSRPWLSRSPEEIAAYVRRHRLRHIEDDTNAEARYARNRLRLQVWPALAEAFPSAQAVLADCANRAGEASQCLQELASIDLDAARDGNALKWSPLSVLGSARRANAVRHWLLEQTGRRPPASLLERLARELSPRGSARWPLPGGELRTHRGRLEVHMDRDAGSDEARPSTLRIAGAGAFRLENWGGELLVEQVAAGGVPLALLRHVQLRGRAGSERFQAGPERPPRSLKKQYQSAGLPAWQRSGPLVFAGEQLLFVPGLGMDARALALPGQPRVQMHWRPLP